MNPKLNIAEKAILDLISENGYGCIRFTASNGIPRIKSITVCKTSSCNKPQWKPKRGFSVSSQLSTEQQHAISEIRAIKGNAKVTIYFCSGIPCKLDILSTYDDNIQD